MNVPHDWLIKPVLVFAKQREIYSPSVLSSSPSDSKNGSQSLDRESSSIENTPRGNRQRAQTRQQVNKKNRTRKREDGKWLSL